jgi:hypothetical protein
MKRLFFILISVSITLISCQTDLDYVVRGYTEKIIVEGKIESGQDPIVYLSLNIPLWQEVDSASIINYIIRDAKITISDGEKTEIMTARWDRTNFLPHYYRATSIKGEEGKTYSLVIEKGGYTLYASTTIPYGFAIHDIKSKPTDVDSLRTIELTINAGEDNNKSYRIFSKKKKDNRFIETPVLFNSSLTQSGNIKIDLSPNPEKKDSSFNEGRRFMKGDTVDVKICAIDSVSTMFYKDLSMFSVKGGNIFISEVKPLNSNISYPGFGIWCGQATKTVRYVVQ